MPDEAVTSRNAVRKASQPEPSLFASPFGMHFYRVFHHCPTFLLRDLTGDIAQRCFREPHLVPGS